VGQVDRTLLLAVKSRDLEFHWSRSLLGRRREVSLATVRSTAGDAELAGLRRFFRQGLLDGLAHRDPAALGARHAAFDENETARNITLLDLEIERGNAIDADLARHLLVLERTSRVLTAAGGTDRAVRDGDAMRGAQAAEVPPLHAARIALANRGAGH